MKPEPKIDGTFPLPMHETREKLHVSVLEVPGDLKKVRDFCVQHEIEVSRFFTTVWSIAFCQFTERDPLYLGFEDVRVDLKPHAGTRAGVIKATVQPQTHIESLLRGDKIEPQLGPCKENAAKCSTALYIAGDDAPIKLGDWLESGEFGKLVGSCLLEIPFRPNAKFPDIGCHHGC